MLRASQGKEVKHGALWRKYPTHHDVATGRQHPCAFNSALGLVVFGRECDRVIASEDGLRTMGDKITGARAGRTMRSTYL